MSTYTSHNIAYALLCGGLAGPLLSSSARAADDGLNVSFAPVLTTGGLDAAAVQTGLEKRVKAIERCYAPALTSAPTLYGQIQVDLNFDAAGQVKTATLSDSTLSPKGDAEGAESGAGPEAGAGAGAGAEAGADVAGCIAGVLQIVPMATAPTDQPTDQPATAQVVVLLAPTTPSHPRKKLAAALSACATGPSPAVSQRSLLARVDVDGGHATAIDIKSIQPLDPETDGCMRLALQLGPYTIGVGARLYRWDLP